MSKEFSSLGHFDPAAIFSEGSLHEWVSSGASLNDLKESAQRLSRVISQTSPRGYPIHFYLARHGIPSLKLQFGHDGIDVWDIRGRSLGTIRSLSKASIATLSEMLDNTLKGRSQCNSCRVWVVDGRTYSYAGFVCNNCYDPVMHLPPKTD